MDPITILLIDRNRLSREDMKRTLTGLGARVLAEASDLADAERVIDDGAEPALILVDLSDDAVASAIDRLRERLPSAAIAVLSTDLSVARFGAALDAGATAYLMKDVTPETLARSLAMIQAGQRVFPTHLAALLLCGRVARNPSALDRRSHGLSEREMQMLDLIVIGDSNKEIASKIGISEATVKVHNKSLFRRIQVESRTQAAVWGHKHGFGIAD